MRAAPVRAGGDGSAMTLGDKFRALAAVADRDPRDVRWRLLCLLDEMNGADFKARPGRFIDDLLGNGGL